MKSITVDFAFSGVLPGTANVTLDLSAAGFADNAKVYLYYYNPQTKQLEKAAGGAAATPAPKATKAPKTGDNNATALYLVLCGMGVAAAGVAAKRKKNLFYVFLCVFL